MQYSVEELAKIMKARLEGAAPNEIHHILTDSRQAFVPKSTVFFALQTVKNDGHNYVSDLISRGCTVFVVSKLPIKVVGCFLVVNNTFEALQLLAEHHRLQFNYPVIAITGSNGKTIVKEWIYQVLHHAKTIVRSPKSYNSQLGVPLSVLQMEDHHTLGVFEAGISEPGEMTRLQDIIKPTIGIFTNIGDAHASGFKTLESKIAEKLILFKDVDVLIYQRGFNDGFSSAIQNFIKQQNCRSLSWSFVNGADVKVVATNLDAARTQLELRYLGELFEIIVPFTEEVSLENIIHVGIVCLALELKLDVLSSYFEHIQPVEMRLTHKDGINGCNLVSDFYNNDLKSLDIALNWASRQNTDLPRTVILSDILQSELSEPNLFAEINRILVQHAVDRLFGIGKGFTSHSDKIEIKNSQFFTSTEHFLNEFSQLHFSNEVIVLKGARNFAFERIEKKLERLVHHTVLEVNLNAMAHNLDFIRFGLPKGTKIMAMVKAFGYGSGSLEIAHFLQFYGADYLGVAYADEGVALRLDGIRIPIMVMNADEDGFDKMLEHSLEPVLYNKRSFDKFSALAKEQIKGKARCHIEINTGMNRLGFDVDEVDWVSEQLRQTNQIELASIFSHYATSEGDNLDDQNLVHTQTNLFIKAFNKLSQNLGYPILKHISNSGASLHYKAYSFDLVRIGIGMHGIDPKGDQLHNLLPVSTLKCRISQLRKVEPNQGVGYGNLSKSNKTRTIAVVSIGYADGLNRLANKEGYFLINGQKAPIVGNICMDMTMCDVSNISCKEGDEVVVFGLEPSLTQMAKWSATIPYEVLTSVSQRVKRVYSEE